MQTCMSWDLASPQRRTPEAKTTDLQAASWASRGRAHSEPVGYMGGRGTGCDGRDTCLLLGDTPMDAAVGVRGVVAEPVSQPRSKPMLRSQEQAYATVAGDPHSGRAIAGEARVQGCEGS